MNVYLTADRVGEPSGGGLVTRHECEALRSLGPCNEIDRYRLEALDPGTVSDPWNWDFVAKGIVGGAKLMHVYSGTFSESVRRVKEAGGKVCYTIAAHDRAASRKAHEDMGIPYADLYLHLCDEGMWRRYIRGYLDADVIVCPSRHSADYVRTYAERVPRIEVIPHGVDLPKCSLCKGSKEFATGPNDIDHWEHCRLCGGTGVEPVKPMPDRFTVGYMGAYGPDKGVVHLLRAWKRLGYRDATLVLAGRDSTSPWVRELYGREGGGSVAFLGWVDDPADYYNRISLHVQPSVSEGFGLEVLEAMAYGRPVLCSEGAGAADVVPSEGRRFPVGDVDALASAIDKERQAHTHYWNQGQKEIVQTAFRREAERYTWDKIRAKYVALWGELLS